MTKMRTIILLNLPVTLYLLQRGLGEGLFDLKLFLKSGVVVALLILVLPLGFLMRSVLSNLTTSS